MKRKLLLALTVSMLLAGCTDAGSLEETMKASGENAQITEESEGLSGTEESSSIDPVTLDNAFQRAAFLADRVYEADQKSTLVSPISLEMALGLVTEGASGETAQELYKYLGNENYADWAREYMDFAKSLNTKEDALPKPSGDGTEELIFEPGSRYTFHYELANSIWVRQDDKLKEAYEKLRGGKCGFCGEARRDGRADQWLVRRTYPWHDSENR